ncbi:MAG: beta-mannosidase [Arenicella sp.]|jgi:beta-mannosidase
MKLLLIISISFISIFGHSQIETEELNTWYLQNVYGKEFKTTIPSNVHMDLYMSGAALHPYRWDSQYFHDIIQEEEFEYITNFLGDDYLEKDKVELVFEGLDTYAEVVLNDSTILFADNMFRSWTIDIKPLLRKGHNQLKVIFTHPVNYNKEKVTKAKYQLPSGNETVNLQVSNYTRKAAYQFGWDWAERYVGFGIWRPVYIRSWKTARISDFYVETLSASQEKATIKYHVEIESDGKHKASLKVDNETYKVKLKEGLNTFSYERQIDNPKLWYPNGYGDPMLHLAKAEIINKTEVVDASAIHYGIRTVELINEADSIGTSFYFKVNGQAIFAKGANYVPQSSFPSEVSAIDHKTLINQVKDANMNILRVWGGGIYEADFFYQLCDQNGILVWQDFMFANSMYPSDKAFHDNIKAEVKENVKRIRKHPCLALWCGNNEIEVAWNNWGWQDSFGWSVEDSTEIWNNYLRIFQEEIPAIVAKESPFIPYVSTSPLSNWGTAENFNHNSMHYWGVWHGDDDFEDFKNNVGRFMVEYGFQSYPTYNQLVKYTLEKVDFDSEFLKNRQKSYIGDKWISREITKRYGEVKDIKIWLKLSQHIQAKALREAITAHRFNSKCMGTLFWQLNDCWVGPSWSVLNYDHTEKIGYEVVKNLYSPQIVVVDTTKEKIVFWAVSDSPEMIKVSLKIKVVQDFETLLEKSIPADLTFLKSQKIYAFTLSDIVKKTLTTKPSISITLKDRTSGDLLFEDVFYFGLSPEEEEIFGANKLFKTN